MGPVADLDELLIDGVLNKEARTSGTILARVVEDAERNPVRSYSGQSPAHPAQVSHPPPIDTYTGNVSP